MMGKIGLAVSPVKTDRIWAVVEAEKGGVYRSDDAGKTWSLICSDRITITRSWYYMEIFADPKDEETVYVLNAPALRSIDGGKSFKPMPVGHGDTHDLWINPDNPANMILGDDGGAEISFNTGASWSTLNNQPTAQFYRVNTDNQYPYQVYGGQQDNSSVIIDSKSVFGGIEEKNWTYGPGCESAYLAFDPDNPRYVLGGCYQGYISLLDRKLQILKDVMEYPNVGLGTTPTDLKYRFNWNAPIVSNPLKPTEIYHGGNALFMTTDWGYGWKKISDDLTRNDKSKQLVGGGPITNEGAGGENYNTIMYVAASPHKDGEIWVGSDDGLLHKTTDKGNNWTEVTPPGLGETMINSIELSPHDASTAYVVSTKYKFNDFTPMIHRTTDGGKSWQKITNGIPYGDYVRVVREDKKRKGLLYAGSERGLYISLDAGSSWSKFQLNLPIVPINDLTIADNDLVAATAGRAFWILDNLSPIQQLLGKEEMKTSQLIAPEKAIRDNLGRSSDPNVGQNPLPGAIIDYWLGEVTDSSNVRLEIRNSDGQVIRRYSNKPEKLMPYPGGPTPEKALPMKKGINRINWNFREDMIPHVPGVFVLGNYQGSEVMPGEYMLRLIVDKDSSEVKLNVAPHPGVKADQSDFRQQYELSKNIDKMVSSIHESVREIRSATEQIRAVQKRVESIEEADTLMSLGNSIIKDMEEWQSVLIQPKQKTFQDVINFPNQLNTELLNLRGRIEGNLPEVTEGAKNRMDDLSAQWTDQRKALDEIIVKLGDFNKLYKELDLPVIITNIKN